MPLRFNPLDGSFNIVPEATGGGGGGPALPLGGLEGQVLIKQSSADGDADWGDIDMLSNYKTHEVDDAGLTTYVGKISVRSGAWLITRIVDTDGDLAILYANQSNNPAESTLASAWPNRVALTYTQINNLTGI